MHTLTPVTSVAATALIRIIESSYSPGKKRLSIVVMMSGRSTGVAFVCWNAAHTEAHLALHMEVRAHIEK